MSHLRLDLPVGLFSFKTLYPLLIFLHLIILTQFSERAQIMKLHSVWVVFWCCGTSCASVLISTLALCAHNRTRSALSWLRHSVGGLSPRSAVLDPRPLPVIFVVHKVALLQVSLPVLWSVFPCQCHSTKGSYSVALLSLTL